MIKNTLLTLAMVTGLSGPVVANDFQYSQKVSEWDIFGNNESCNAGLRIPGAGLVMSYEFDTKTVNMYIKTDSIKVEEDSTPYELYLVFLKNNTNVILHMEYIIKNNIIHIYGVTEDYFRAFIEANTVDIIINSSNVIKLDLSMSSDIISGLNSCIQAYNSGKNEKTGKKM